MTRLPSSAWNVELIGLVGSPGKMTHNLLGVEIQNLCLQVIHNKLIMDVSGKEMREVRKKEKV